MAYVFDLEVYPNLFLAVFYDTKNKTFIKFILWDDNGAKVNEINKLIIFLKENKNSWFIGYNSLGYDMQILTEICKNPYITNEEIKAFNDKLIDSEWPIYKEKQLCNKTLDIMLVNNYGHRSPKRTSLKKIEFQLRKKSIKDLPYHFNDLIEGETKLNEVIKYCEYDCLVTSEFVDIVIDLVKLREEFGALNNINIINSPEPDMVKKYITKALSLEMGISEYEVSNLKSYHKEIKGKDIILPYMKIEKIPEFKEVYDFYNNLVLYPTVTSNFSSDKIISLKNTVSKKIVHKNVEYVYMAGGLHGCIIPGIYESNDEYIIEDYDKVSYYPHFAMKHGISPDHFPSDIYAKIINDVFLKRQQYNKKDFYHLNHAFKIIINVAFGLSNSEYSMLFDTKCTLATTVNGMLTLTMLLDKLYHKVPGLQVLQANTDGITMRYHRKYKELVHSIYDEQTRIDSIPYETVEYKKMVISNVNSYIGIYNDDSIKAKGIFETYEDIMKKNEFQKDTSASVIKVALQNYYVKGIPIEDTINNHNNIYDFCYGNPGSSLYKWHLSEYNPQNGVTKSELFNHRFVRYYAGGYCTLGKLWLKGKRKDGIESIQAETPITMLMTVPKTDILDLDKNGNHKPRYNKDNEIIYRYPNLNRDWYIKEAYKIVNSI